MGLSKTVHPLGRPRCSNTGAVFTFLDLLYCEFCLNVAALKAWISGPAILVAIHLCWSTERLSRWYLCAVRLLAERGPDSNAAPNQDWEIFQEKYHPFAEVRRQVGSV